MLLLLLACTGTHPVEPPPATEDAPEVQVTPRLVAEPGALSSGAPFRLAVRYEITPGWHVYWDNPGETGLSTTAELTAPEGFTLSAVAYPGPERFVSPGDIVSFGYEEDAALLFEVTPPAEPGPGPHAFTATTDWLACSSVCIKGSAELSLSLPGQGEDLSPFVQRLPRPLTSHAGAALTWSEDRSQLTLTLPGATAAELFPSADLQLALGEVLPGEVDRAATLTLRFKTPQDALLPGVVRVTPPRGDAFFLSLSESPS